MTAKEEASSSCLPSNWGSKGQQTGQVANKLVELSLQPGSPTSFSKVPCICLFF